MNTYTLTCSNPDCHVEIEIEVATKKEAENKANLYTCERCGEGFEVAPG